MEENPNLWNKQVNELTVRDSVVLSVAAPVIMIGAAVAYSAVAGGASKLARKFRERKNAPIETPTEG